MNELRQYANTPSRTRRKEAGDLYIYEGTLDSGQKVHLFSLEPNNGNGLSLVRKIHVNEVGNFYKFLMRKLKDRWIGEIYNLTADDVNWISGIVPDDGVLPKPVVPKPKPIIPTPATASLFGKSPIREGYVYVLKAHDNVYKIGRARNPENRMRTFEIKLPFPVEFELLIKTDDMHSLEMHLHQRFSHKRINGEWFRLDNDDIESLKALVNS